MLASVKQAPCTTGSSEQRNIVATVGTGFRFRLNPEQNGSSKLNSVTDGMASSIAVSVRNGLVSDGKCATNMFSGMLMMTVKAMVTLISATRR